MSIHGSTASLAPKQLLSPLAVPLGYQTLLCRFSLTRASAGPDLHRP